MRIVFSQSAHYVSLLLALSEDLGETFERLGVGLWTKKSLNYEIMNDPRCLPARGSEKPANSKEVGAVGGEGSFEPIDAMEEKCVVLLGGQAHSRKGLKSRSELLAGLLRAKNQLVEPFNRSLGGFLL